MRPGALAISLLSAACTANNTAPQQRCEPIEADLLDARAVLEDRTPIFDKAQPPRFRATEPQRSPLAAILTSTAIAPVRVELRVETSSGAFFFSGDTWPEFKGSASLALQSGHCPPQKTWPIRWNVAPENLPALRKIASLKAEKNYQAVARVLSADLPHLDPWSKVWASMEIARAHGARGDGRASLDAWLEAAKIAEKAGVPSQTSWALRSAAFQAQWLRQYSEVAQLLERAETIDRRIANEVGLAKVLFYRGLLAQELGLYRRAERHFENAARASRALGRAIDEASALKSRAYLLRIEGRFEEALETLSRIGANLRSSGELAAASHANELGGVMLEALETRGPGKLGRFEIDPETIERHFTEAQSIAAKNGANQIVAVALMNRAWLEFWRGRIDEAEASLQKIGAIGQHAELERLPVILLRALISLKRGDLGKAENELKSLDFKAREETGGGESDYTWRAAYGLGQVAKARGDKTKALANFREAIAILERVARQTALQRGRAPFESDRRRVVEEAIDLSLELGKPAEAFEIADAAAARLVAALETEARISRLGEAARREWNEKLAAYAARREAYDGARDEETMLAGAELRAWRSARAAERSALQRSFEDLYTLLEERAPEFAPRSPKTRDLIEALGPKQALISFVRDGARWRSFWVDDRGVRAKHLETADILQPWRDELGSVDHLVVSPGVLQEARDLVQLVFQGKPLIETLRVSFVPHAGFVARDRVTTGTTALVIADPDGTLPGARAEAAWVAAKLGVEPLIGDRASRAEVLPRLRSASILHFSGHGQLRPSNPWEAHLVLARGETLNVEDVLISAARPSLVVLSGCETGVSQALSRDHSIGLPEAFLVAGARGVLATERPIDDGEAKQFVTEFYERGGAIDPASAYQGMAKAAIASKKEGWSAFRWIGAP